MAALSAKKLRPAGEGRKAKGSENQRKRSSDVPDQPKTTCRKRRAMSGFNLWHSQYMQSVESQRFSSLGEKNKQSALQWRSLTEEEREKYCSEAAAHNCGDAIVNSKKEADKIIRHLVDTGEHADMLDDFHFMYVVVHNRKHYVGGSTSGCDYLRDNSHIPYSFIGHLSAKAVSQPRNEATSDDKDLLRKEVTKIFNEHYAQHVEDPNARMPYSKIQEYGIRMEGLPSGKTLKNPTAYGKTTLQDIIANKDSLKLHVDREKRLSIQETNST